MRGRYRRIRQIALGINALMFAGELLVGLHVDTVSLLADAVDLPVRSEQRPKASG